jgi:predicted nucleotidyltransferase
MIEMEPGASVKLCTPEDLIVMKAFADRDLDWNDIRGIIVRQGADNLDWNHIFEHLAPLCEAKEAPGIMTRLRKMK